MPLAALLRNLRVCSQAVPTTQGVVQTFQLLIGAFLTVESQPVRLHVVSQVVRKLRFPRQNQPVGNQVFLPGLLVHEVLEMVAQRPAPAAQMQLAAEPGSRLHLKISACSVWRTLPFPLWVLQAHQEIVDLQVEQPALLEQHN